MKYTELPRLATKRCILRPVERRDASDMFEYSQNSDVGPMAGWAPHKNQDESLAIINDMREKFLTDTNIGVFSIEYQGKMIGTVGIHRYHKRYSSCEIGYVLNPDYWGMGIMTEACQKVISWLFDDFDIYRIEIGHFDFNEKSKRVIEKLGFTFEGTSRKKIVLIQGGRCDSYNYSILKEEYLNKELPWQ